VIEEEEATNFLLAAEEGGVLALPRKSAKHIWLISYFSNDESLISPIIFEFLARSVVYNGENL
jgi:hypothetical protein